MQEKQRSMRLAVQVVLVLILSALVSTAGARETRKKASAKNKAAAAAFCKSYKADNPGASCVVDKRVCPRGHVAERKWKGRGTNYSACVKGRKTERPGKKKDQGTAAARAWCEEFERTSGESCRYVKTGAVCPLGYHRYTKLKNKNIRNQKICVRGKKSLKKDQVVKKNTDAKHAGLTARALTWLRKNFDDATNEFKIASKGRKTTRLKKRLSRKFEKVRVVWHRKNDDGCEKESVHGYRKRGQPRTVHICAKRVLPNAATTEKEFCSLVGTIFHEIAHTARIPISKIHNDTHNPDRLKDHVYQLGIKARSACRKDLGVTRSAGL